MKRLLPFLLATLCLGLIPAGAQTPPAEASVATTAAKDGLFIHISSGPDFPHRALMALKLADKASTDGAYDVFVYFDIKGVELVVSGSPEVNFEGFPSSADLLARLQERGVPMAACPSCLQVIGRTPDQLIAGVKVASLNDFFGFTKGRILTLDY